MKEKRHHRHDTHTQTLRQRHTQEEREKGREAEITLWRG